MTRRSKAPTRRTPSPLGTTEQLPSGRWRAFYRRDGRKFTGPHTFATAAEANAWLAGEQADRARGVWRDPELQRVTLGEFARDWLATRGDLAEGTRALYRDVLEAWITPRIGASSTARGIELGAMPVADITPANVRAWHSTALATARERIAERRAVDLARRSDPVRVWAKSTGRRVADTGRLPTALVRDWEAAGKPMPPRPTPLVPDNAGRAVVTNAYRLLRQLLNVAVNDGLIDRNPCQIKGAGEPRSPERPFASAAEVTELAALVPRRFAAAVQLAAWSALRAGELFALARRHVDLDAGTVRVERALHPARAGMPHKFGEPKTAKSRRTVKVPGFVVEMLRDHMAEFVADDPDALLFTLEGGAVVSSSRRSLIFKRATAAIGRPELHWHDLRHTGATLAYGTGATQAAVQRRLGHVSNRAAALYAHATDDADAVIAAGLDALYAETARGGARLRAV